MKPDNIEERIREAMTGEETVPRDQLWMGIATRRAAGERVVLPVTSKRRTGIFVASAIAAAGLLLLLPLFEPPGLQERPATPASNAQGSREGGSLLLPGSLMAQASATPAFAAQVTAASDRRPGRWTHGRFEHGELRETFTFELSRTTYQGAPAWLLLSSMHRGGRTWNLDDSTYASIDSMQPLLRIAHTGETRIEQTYRKDDILTGITRNGFTSWTTIPQRDPSLPFGGGVLFRPSEISMRLMAMDLAEGWKGSIPLPASGEQGIASLWLNLVVDGSETLKVPAGTFETWRLRTIWGKVPVEPYDSAHPPAGLYFWVSKGQRWLVQMSIVSRDRQVDDTPLVLIKGEEQ